MDSDARKKMVEKLKRDGMYEFLTDEQKKELLGEEPKEKDSSEFYGFFDFLRDEGSIGEEEYHQLKNECENNQNTNAGVSSSKFDSSYNLPKKGRKMRFEDLRQDPFTGNWDIPPIIHEVGIIQSEWNNFMNNPNNHRYCREVVNNPHRYRNLSQMQVREALVGWRDCSISGQVKEALKPMVSYCIKVMVFCILFFIFIYIFARVIIVPLRRDVEVHNEAQRQEQVIPSENQEFDDFGR